MKSITRALLFSGLVIAGFSACHKDYSSSSTPSTGTPLTLSTTSVARGEAMVATVPAGFSTNGLTWTVRPAAGTSITPGNGNASITFSYSGTYYITATSITDSATGKGDSCTAPITVTDSVYTPPTDSISAAGKKFILVPVSVTDSSVNLLLRTVDSFPCTYGILMGQNSEPWGDSITVFQIQGGFSNDLCGVNVPSVANFYQHTLTVGSSASIWIWLPWGGGTYQVKMTATASGYTFSMASETGTQLSISPTEISN